MKQFIKGLFVRNRNKEEKDSSEMLTEAQILDVLSDAVSDVGYWSWWMAELPTLVHIEFGGAQLYFPIKDKTQPPSSQIAIQFVKPKSISFLTSEELMNNENSWFEDLRNDKIEPLDCSAGYFTFTDSALMSQIINEAKDIHTIYGYSPKDKLFQTEKYKLVFWAGDFGFAVSSDKIKLISINGTVKLEKVPSIKSEWWTYWKKYWSVRDTEDALPKDYACELTIPPGATITIKP